MRLASYLDLFFFNDTATTEIYTLSLHDALPISGAIRVDGPQHQGPIPERREQLADRKSTRLNSSHVSNSYAVFCLKKKKKTFKYRQPEGKQNQIQLRYRFRNAT